MATKNRRRHLRTKAQNVVAHLRIGDRSVMAPIEDISMGGVFLRTTEAIAHGTLLAFDVARPGLKRPLRLMGTVVDTRQGRGLGLRFNALDPETTDRLSELMRDLGGIVGATMADPIEVAAPRPQPPRPTTQTGIPAVGTPPAATNRTTGTIPPISAPPPTGSFAEPSKTGTFAPPATDEASRLMVQLRGAIMEIGNLQQQLLQKDRELAELKAHGAGNADETRKREAAESLVGKLEMEKMRLQEQLATSVGKTRGDIELVKREAEQVIGAMNRLVEALKRLG
jgi:hypothetical protein